MIQQLRARFWALIMPILIGLFVIIYAAMGLIYFQQQREQSDLEALIDQRTATVSQPVELSEEEEANYEAAQQAITTGLVDEDEIRIFREDVIEKVLEIAETLGFDADDITSFTYSDNLRTETIGETSYKVIPFQIKIEGDYNKVIAFISTLDSMPDMKTFVLKDVDITIGAEKTVAELDFGIYTLE